MVTEYWKIFSTRQESVLCGQRFNKLYHHTLQFVSVTFQIVLGGLKGDTPFRRKRLPIQGVPLFIKFFKSCRPNMSVSYITKFYSFPIPFTVSPGITFVKQMVLSIFTSQPDLQGVSKRKPDKKNRSFHAISSILLSPKEKYSCYGFDY